MHFNLFNIFLWVILCYKITLDVVDGYLPGETYPEVIEAAVGDNFSIICRMNPSLFSDRSAHDLYFMNEHTKKPVPTSDIVYINETTIMYEVRDAKEQMLTWYLCKCGEHAIMATKVYVGYPPRPVQDFQCHSYDFEYMVCNFTESKNPLLAKHQLTFQIHSSAYFYEPNCNFRTKPYIVCNTTMEQQSHTYEEYYNYTLRATNSLGTFIQNFTINNFDVMELARPGENFRVISLQTDAIEVAWRMKKWENYRLRGLQWEILLTPANFPTMNLTQSTRVERIRNEIRMRLLNLPYAFYEYELSMRVRLNSTAATTHWSLPFTYRFMTAARRPDRPPRTNSGSFHLNSSETQVRIYWEELEPYEFNGDNFTYVITEVWKDDKMSQGELPLYMESNSAVFAWHKYSHYKFTVHSQNHVGTSIDASYVEIFPLVNWDFKQYKPNAIQNAYHDSNNSYTLTWRQPHNVNGLLSYTVYWCYSKLALQNVCKGSIHFEELSPMVLRFETAPQQEGALNLAVSANYRSYNLGMQWTTCTEDVNSNLIKMEPEVTPASETSLCVEWTQTICPSILLGYNLSYCEMEDEICLATLNVTVDKNAKNYTIDDLKPYTRYRVQMFMVSRTRVGRISEPVYRRTLEGTPSPPRQLQVTDVTNTTATLSWQPPSQPNGEVRAYIVHLGTQQFIVEPEANEVSGKIVYKLKNLISNTVYKAYVVAQTVMNSDFSNDIHFKTLIGYPSVPEHVEIERDKFNDTIIRWTRPTELNGRVECYEISVTQMSHEAVVRRRISVVCGSMSCALKLPSCPDEEYRTNIDVRAVNVAHFPKEVAKHEQDRLLPSSIVENDFQYYVGNEDLVCANYSAATTTTTNPMLLTNYHNTSVYRLYKSNWYKVSTHQCSINRLTKYIALALVAVFPCMCLCYLFYPLYKQIHKMANIKCALPPELDVCLSKDNCFPTEFVTDKKFQRPRHTGMMPQNNQKYHLLASLGSDTFIFNTSNADSAATRAMSIDNSVASCSSMKSSDSIVLADRKNNANDCTQSSLSISESERSFTHNEDLQQSDYIQHLNDIPAVVPTSGGYVTVDSVVNKPLKSSTMMSPPSVAPNGYVSVNDFANAANINQKNANLCGGYTTMTELKNLGIH